MRRRQAILSLGAATLGFPLVARAQAPRPLIGFLNGGSEESFRVYLDGFRRGLRDAGYVEGQNVDLEFQWGEGHYDRLRAQAARFVERKVDVIVATGGAPAAQAAKAATSTIPIIFHIGPDPVAARLVESLNRPGGNATGVALLTAAAWTKRLQLAATIADANATLGVLVNPDYPVADPRPDEMEKAASAIDRRIAIAGASNAAEIAHAVTTFASARVGALVVSTDPFFLSEREKIAALALTARLPTVVGWAEMAKAGCLISYGSDQRETYYQIGIYTGRVLKGEKPADLPVLQATRLLLVINLKTAKSLGVTVPVAVFALADEVIE